MANFKVELNSITPCAFAKAAAVGWNNLLDHFYSSFLPDALRSSYVVSWVVQTRQDWALKSSEWTSWLDNQWKRSIPCTKKRSNTKMIDDVWNSRRQCLKRIELVLLQLIRALKGKNGGSKQSSNFQVELKARNNGQKNKLLLNRYYLRSIKNWYWKKIL